jgi:translation elongation factor EF-1alpha
METEIAQVTMHTAQPILIEDFSEVQELGRFVLVRDMDVVAGGIIAGASPAFGLRAAG